MRPTEGYSVDPDLAGLLAAVGEAGAEVDAPYWDDPGVDWSAYDLVVIRSTWDYCERPEEFVAWAERCGEATRLANPVEVVRWNADKRYLGELAEGGVPTVPTWFVGLGEGAVGPVGEGFEGLEEFKEFVVKPTSGNGARYAARYGAGDGDAARRHVARLHAEGLTAMVQPYVRAVDVTGERALVFFGGRFLHAVRKGAVLAPGVAYDAAKVAHPGRRAWVPSAGELALAERALGAVPGGEGLLYARVDVVDGEGGLCVMEVELVEPNLFLSVCPGAFRVVGEGVVGVALRGSFRQSRPFPNPLTRLVLKRRTG
ncbi:RimK family alpha-L-glutamate ligase [Streptomyces sp. NPDC059009]|uniref:ATP-grasp domain-containing protein n=1 Tax=Streptomyces sp. NPDC059009 TaxID=3346694 RepID=UPI00367FF139